MVPTFSKPGRKYFDIAETAFKERFRNRIKDLRCEKHINNSERTKYMWKFKDEEITRNIKWNKTSIVEGTTEDSV